MVEAEISPEMIKRKKKKKKRRKEVRTAEEAAAAGGEHHAYHQREFGRSSVPRLPKLPRHPSLVANLQEQQRRQQMQEEDVLPGSYPEFQACEETAPHPQHPRGWYSYNRGLLAEPLARSQLPQGLGLGPGGPPAPAPARYPRETQRVEGMSLRMAHVARVPASRQAGYAPVHSRTNLMEAELMDADSDF